MLEDAQQQILVLHAILDGLEIVQYLIAHLFLTALQVVILLTFVLLVIVDGVEIHVLPHVAL